MNKLTKLGLIALGGYIIFRLYEIDCIQREKSLMKLQKLRDMYSSGRINYTIGIPDVFTFHSLIEKI